MAYKDVKYIFLWNVKEMIYLWEIILSYQEGIERELRVKQVERFRFDIYW